MTRIIFPESTSIEEATVWLSPGERAAIRDAGRGPFDADRVSFLRVRDTDFVIGYSFVDDVKGLHEMITYLTALNTDGTVRAVEILAYRESHGFEIKDKRFRNQFAGKRTEDPLRVGTDIRNIAGATLSANAIAAGVRKILAIHKIAVAAKSSPVNSPAGGSRIPSRMSRADTDAATLFRRSRMVWGTMLTIEAEGASGAHDAVRRAFDEVDRLTTAFNRWDSASELSRVLRDADGSPVAVSADLFALCQLALDMKKRTGNRFDPLFRTPMAGRTVTLLPGLPKRIQIDTGAVIDLDGIAKGYAVDRITAILRDAGVRRAMVNFGGSSMAAVGAWTVNIRNPAAPRDSGLFETLAIRDAVLSVSAAYERGPHIVDPLTGKPADKCIQAVVAGPRGPDAGAIADALSTALFVAGADGLAFARESGFEGKCVNAAGTEKTAGFSAFEGTKP